MGDKISLLSDYNQEALFTKQKVMGLKSELVKIENYREELGRALVSFQVNKEEDMKIPFKFFHDLQREH